MGRIKNLIDKFSENFNSKQESYTILSLGGLVLILMIFLGNTLGRMLVENSYIINYQYDEFIKEVPSLPSKILDVNNNLVTELSYEDRTIINAADLPKSVIFALLAREDSMFYDHNGFSFIGTARAAIYIILNRLFKLPTAGGGSTITQQLAGKLKADRNDISLDRKLKELWWSFQFERQFSKDEILENYLNIEYFGDRNYGIEAASEFLFGHSAEENTIGESAVLVIQLARPNGDYSPLKNPENAKIRQKAVLNKVVKMGFMTQEEVDQSYDDYWNNIDLTKSTQRITINEDRAPYFSEYVRHQLDSMLYGQSDIYQDGYTIYSTIDLNKQAVAEQIVEEEMAIIDRIYKSNSSDVFSVLRNEEIPFLYAMQSLFSLNGLNISAGQEKRRAKQILQNELAVPLELLTLNFDLNELKPEVETLVKQINAFNSSNVPETAMLSIDNSNGYIVSMVGGRQYKANQSNQFNRATDAGLTPGSAFKPLYFAAAIKEAKLSPATMLMDYPYVFRNPDESSYSPENYYGNYKGPILTRRALALSLNIPAIHVLEKVGFDKAIPIISKLLGYSNKNEIRRQFPRVYPLALGISSIPPIRMARAYSVFANKGIVKEPIAIRYVKDRNGVTILNREAESIQKQREASSRILSPQEAYLMTDLLSTVVHSGTLTSMFLRHGQGFKQALAAKTGTSQNWEDGWTVGYSPYYTTVTWVGFDKRGSSLGENLYGGRVAGSMWMRYMKEAHKGLPVIGRFTPPETGIVYAGVDSATGLLWDPSCRGKLIREVFISGTVPTESCTEASVDNNILPASIFAPSSTPDLDLDDLLGTIDASTRKAILGLEDSQVESPVAPSVNPDEEPRENISAQSLEAAPENLSQEPEKSAAQDLETSLNLDSELLD